MPPGSLLWVLGVGGLRTALLEELLVGPLELRRDVRLHVCEGTIVLVAIALLEGHLHDLAGLQLVELL